MQAIVRFIRIVCRYVGALALIIGGTIRRGWNLLAQIPYEEIGQKTQRVGIITLLFTIILLAATVIGLSCGYNGHWIASSWLLGYAIVGFGLLLGFEYLIFGALKITVFSFKLAALAVVHPGFLATKGILGEILKILKLPGKPFEWLDQKLTGALAVQLNTWFKKSPAEIRELFELMEEPEEADHSNQQAWDANWKRVEGELEKAGNEAEKIAQTIFFWTQACLGFVAFMAIFFFIVAPNSHPVPMGMGLDNSLKRIWIEFTGNRIFLLAVTLAGLFGAFAVSRKPKTTEATQ